MDAMVALLGGLVRVFQAGKAGPFLFPNAPKSRKPLGRPKAMPKSDWPSVLKWYGDAMGWTSEERNAMSPRQRQRERAKIREITGMPKPKAGRPKKSDNK